MRLGATDVLVGRDVAVVDVEGNGQQPPEIIEIAILPVSGTEPATPSDMRSWLVRPVQPITSVVTRKVHGITNDDVADSPPWSEVSQDVTEVLSGKVLVAHNAVVERRVLGSHLPGWRPPQVLDTLRLARAVWPGLTGYGLDQLIGHAGLTVPSPHELLGPGGTPVRRHRAGYDAWMTAALLVALITDADLEWSQVITRAALPDTTPAAHAPPAAPSEGATPTDPEGLW